VSLCAELVCCDPRDYHVLGKPCTEGFKRNACTLLAPIFILDRALRRVFYKMRYF
jgi:hypothetical protein